MKAFSVHIIAFLLLLSFGVVTTADFWKNSASASVLLVEIEPSKGDPKPSDSNNDLKKDQFKEKFCLQQQSVLAYQSSAIRRLHGYLAVLPAPYLSLPDLPPELV